MDLQENQVAEKESKIEVKKLDEPVCLAGAIPRQLTGQEAGRVVGFGCD